MQPSAPFKFFLLLGVVAIIACTPTRSKIAPPYPLRSGAVDAEQLQLQAEATCKSMQQPIVNLPPHAFTTDGCSMWPDSTWASCCIEHDLAYWCGGTPEQRVQADKALRVCVRQQSNRFHAWLMYWGVRVGGSPYTPSPWRWGYGYDWPYKRGEVGR